MTANRIANQLDRVQRVFANKQLLKNTQMACSQLNSHNKLANAGRQKNRINRFTFRSLGKIVLCLHRYKAAQ
jgi:hypothetical protein